VRETQSKAPRCAVDELIKNPHWPRPLGREGVHKALKKYRAELVKDEPEYKWIGPAGPLDRWTEMRLQVMRIERTFPLAY
jgi:hypothetical protein